MPSTSGPVKVAIGLMLLSSALTTLPRIRQAVGGLRPPAEDEITGYERRFLELRSALPARGIVGYVTDPPVQDSSPARVALDAHDRFKRYLLAQYALAPLVLVESTRPELVVGNFARPSSIPGLSGLQTIREFGGGVVLYRRTAQ
jgi:hypothetical protein